MFSLLWKFLSLTKWIKSCCKATRLNKQLKYGLPIIHCTTSQTTLMICCWSFRVRLIQSCKKKIKKNEGDIWANTHTASRGISFPNTEWSSGSISVETLMGIHWYAVKMHIGSERKDYFLANLCSQGNEDEISSERNTPPCWWLHIKWSKPEAMRGRQEDIDLFINSSLALPQDLNFS